MPKGKAPQHKPGRVAIRQAKAGNYTHAVNIVYRAMQSPNTKPKLAAKSRAIAQSSVAAKVFRMARKRLGS